MIWKQITLFRKGASYLSENIIRILILQWNVFNSNIYVHNRLDISYGLCFE